MEHNEMAKKAAQMFATPTGRIVDILYATSDGKLHLSSGQATSEAMKLVDQNVTPFYRDGSIRRYAEKDPKLLNTLIAADYLKSHKRARPTYIEYVMWAKKKGVQPVDDELYKFMQTKVFPSGSPVMTGFRDEIYIYGKGRVKAVFLRRYDQAMVWQYHDELVVTSLFHTELMKDSYRKMFEPILETA